jgi:hypothetical protein
LTKLYYRPSCLIEAYGSPRKYWLVRGGLLANNLFNEGAIFWQKEWQVFWMYSATSQSDSTAMDDIGWSNWREALPGLLPSKRVR